MWVGYGDSLGMWFFPGPDVDSPEAKAAVLGILTSPLSSSSSHNKSILTDLVSQGTQTGSLNSPTDKPEQVGGRQEEEERTQPTTWLGPGPNGGKLNSMLPCILMQAAAICWLLGATATPAIWEMYDNNAFLFLSPSLSPPPHSLCSPIHSS